VEDEIDITKYPEGVDAVIKSLDFLPDDSEVRTNYVITLIMFLNSA
jgi:hypothetical protein